MVKISVIIPVYNEELYLEQCLDSVCNQTLREIEILCIDDGSTDASLNILEQFANKDFRIKVFRQWNQYAGTARNLGIQKAQGKYLCFLDSDDFFAPDLLEKMYQAAEENQSEIVICEAQYFDDKTGEIKERNIPIERQFLPSDSNNFCKNDIAEGIFQITNGWAWDKLFLARFIQNNKLRFVGSRTANDGYFVYMALALADKITKIHEVLVTQRIHNSNSLVNTRVQSWKCGFDMVDDIKRGLLEKKIYVQLEKSFLNWALKYIVWSFDSMEAWEGKEQIYNYVQKAEQSLCILKYPLEHYYFPTEYSFYKQITQKSFGNYVADVMMKMEYERNRLTEHQEQIITILNKKKWLFPFAKLPQNSSVVLYGTGQVGQDYYKQITDSGYCKVVLWMDKKFAEKCFYHEDTICGWIKELGKVNYDKIVLALSRDKDIAEATELLLQQGVKRQQIV